MLIDFNELKEITIPNMNGWEGKVIAKMDVNDCGRFIQTVIPPKSSIGLEDSILESKLKSRRSPKELEEVEEPVMS